MSDSQTPYGFRYFDRPTDYEEGLNGEDEQENSDDELSAGHDQKSCPANCCDSDCECDDCVRCSDTGLIELDSYGDNVAAAA